MKLSHLLTGALFTMALTAAQANELASLRADIDEIDTRIVYLLAQRTQLVKQISHLKTTKRDLKREAAILHRVDDLAFSLGADRNTVQQTFTCMMDGFVAMQEGGHDE